MPTPAPSSKLLQGKHTFSALLLEHLKAQVSSTRNHICCSYCTHTFLLSCCAIFKLPETRSILIKYLRADVGVNNSVLLRRYKSQCYLPYLNNFLPCCSGKNYTYVPTLKQAVNYASFCTASLENIQYWL